MSAFRQLTLPHPRSLTPFRRHRGWRAPLRHFLAALCLIGTKTGQADQLAQHETDDLSIQGLETLLRTKNIRTVEQLLAALPLRLRSNYTLQFRGNGLQGGSRDNPRVFLFGESGRLVLTFNGGEAVGRPRAVEILHYSPETEAFELFDLDLSRSTKDPSVRPALEKNPVACLSCHQAGNGRIRAFFPSLNRWDGFYGAKGFPLTNEDSEALRSFNSRRRTHPRYRFLAPKTAFLRDPGLAPFDSGVPASFAARPNQRLMKLLYWRNSRSLIQELRSSPDYAKVLPLIALFHVPKEASGRDPLFSATLDRLRLEEIEKAGCRPGLAASFAQHLNVLHDRLGTPRESEYLRRELRLQSVYESVGIPESAALLSMIAGDPFLFELGLYPGESRFLINGAILTDFHALAEKRLGSDANPFGLVPRRVVSVARNHLRVFDDLRFASRLEALASLADLSFTPARGQTSSRRCQLFESIESLLSNHPG
jgi:hypothetical protein